MNCPQCDNILTSKTDGRGWYAECKNPSCLTSIGKILSKIIFYTDTTRIEYHGIFKNKKELTRFINKTRIKNI